MKTIKTGLGLVALALASLHVGAAETWQWKSGSSIDYTPNVVTSGGVTATPQAWANTGGSPLLEPQPASSNFVVWYDNGLGINNLDGCNSGTGCDAGDTQSSVPEHAIDNNQRQEMVLFSFTKGVQLSTIGIGYVGTDTATNVKDGDYSVLAYVGGGAPNLASSSITSWASLLNNGWQLVSHYENTSTGDKALSTVAKPVSVPYSSYWLIGAYNPMGSSSLADNNSDYIKINALSANVCTTTTSNGTCGGTSKVPEPGSLALLGLGLVGMIRMRKARKA